MKTATAQPLPQLNNNPNHVFVATPYGPGYWVPRGDYVEDTVKRGAKNSGYNNFLKMMRPQARTALDVGANIGEITYALAQFSEKVQAFEPVHNTFDLLQKNVTQNNLTNVTCHNLGLGAVHETAEIAINANTCGANSRVLDPTATRRATETMRIVPLDSFGFTDVDILKIDVEGFELDVLQGGEKTILRDHPVIQLEVYMPALKRARRDIADIYHWLIQRGYQAYYCKHRKITQEGSSYTVVPRCIERFFVHSSETVPTEVPKDVRAL